MALDDERYIGALTVEEAQQLTLAFLDSRGEVGATEDDIVAMLNVFNVWAIGKTLLEMSLKGALRFELTQDKDDLTFWLPPELAEEMTEQKQRDLDALLGGTLEIKGDEYQEADEEFLDED